MVEILSNLHLISGGLSVSPDIVKVLVVFLCASLFYFILFSAQILLIYRIEQGRLSRRRERQNQPETQFRRW